MFTLMDVDANVEFICVINESCTINWWVSLCRLPCKSFFLLKMISNITVELQVALSTHACFLQLYCMIISNFLCKIKL